MREGYNNVWGRFYPSEPDFLDQFAGAITNKRFLDLGSGDGSIVERAEHLGAIAWGVEADIKLVKTSKSKDRIIHKNLFDLDLSKYDVLYYYNRGCALQKELWAKIEKEFRGFIIVYNG